MELACYELPMCRKFITCEFHPAIKKLKLFSDEKYCHICLRFRE